eukprot:gene30509-37740_t
MDRTKNDPRGDGPVEAHQSLCAVLHGLDYMAIIPDPLGRGQEAIRLTNPDAAGATLKLMRARTTHAPRVFIRANLGIGKLREIMQRINQKLPESMQMDNIRGHTGRRTFVSTAINAGVDSQVVAQASHHKDVNSLKKYFVPDAFASSRASVACASTSMRTMEASDTSSSSGGGDYRGEPGHGDGTNQYHENRQAPTPRVFDSAKASFIANFLMQNM